MNTLLIIAIIVVIVILFFIYNRFLKKKETNILTPEMHDILHLLKNTNENIFITGKAGTGKSWLVKYFLKHSNKKAVVLAPTGMAASNIKGQTIHSFFRWGHFIQIGQIKPDPIRHDMFMSLQMIIIDEVSMVRADLMHFIDVALRRNRVNNLPFGGVQMVFIGDMFQLPPIVKENERKHMFETYGGQYFFDAPVFSGFNFQFKELTVVLRQTEKKFIDILNNIREDKATFTDDLVPLHKRHIDNITKEHTDSVVIATKNDIVDDYNKKELGQLKGEKYTFNGTFEPADISDKKKESFEKDIPFPYTLEIKQGCQIVMLKNKGNIYHNGSIGIVQSINEEAITVIIDGKSHEIKKEVFEVSDYVLNKKKKTVELETKCTFEQFPMKPAYALTIHKAQGQTFDKITIDIGTGAWAHGQVYTALSRCKSLDGIVLKSEIKDTDIIVDSRIKQFYEARKIPPKLHVLAETDILSSLLNAMNKAIKVKINYNDSEGLITERTISVTKIDEKVGLIRAVCHLRNEYRNFRINRILNVAEL